MSNNKFNKIFFDFSAYNLSIQIWSYMKPKQNGHLDLDQDERFERFCYSMWKECVRERAAWKEPTDISFEEYREQNFSILNKTYETLIIRGDKTNGSN